MPDGRSAYRLWLDEGYEGTLYDFFKWLQGKPGKDGPPGKSALEVWRDEGNPYGTVEEFFESLRGPRGWPGGGGGFGSRQPGEPNGFEDYTQAVLSWDDATRTLTVDGVDGQPFWVWADGVRFGHETASHQIDDVEGDHFIYFDRDQKMYDIPTFDVSVIREKAFVAYVYWDATNKRAVPFSICETHGATMDGATHEYTHTVNGTQYISGISLTVPSVDGTGDDPADAQFVSTAGVIWDEDIKHTVLAHAQTDAIPVLWREGDNGDWRCDDTASFPATKGTSTTHWNKWTGTTWERTEAGNNNFVLGHIWAVPGTNVGTGQVIVIMGQSVYATKNLAQAGAPMEIWQLEIEHLPTQEFVPVASVILQTSSGYTNPVAAKILSTDTGAAYVSHL